MWEGKRGSHLWLMVEKAYICYTLTGGPVLTFRPQELTLSIHVLCMYSCTLLPMSTHCASSKQVAVRLI